MTYGRRLIVLLVVSGVLTSPATMMTAAEKTQAAAGQVDRLLAEELFDADSRVAMPADDEIFLRRIYLDLIGQPPTANQITAFGLDGSADKRARIVTDLLASEKFGENWARYWWDVIIFRASESRAAIFGRSGMQFLADSLNKKEASWRDITKSLITVVGDVPSNGNSILVFAQEGKSEEIAAEVSRIFLGIQIQCAQCHDHPYDRWKREQFHELAAFFGGVGMTRTLDRPDIYFREMRERRGGTTPQAGSQRRPRTLFGWAVYSTDNPPRRRSRGGASAVKTDSKYYLPNLSDPATPGKLVVPALFATGQKAKAGMGDAQRRALLADWLTAKDNRWFSQAFVNRMWSELVGEGFYEPVDDMGEDRAVSAPRTLDYLAGEFAENDYNIKWLFATITATDAYRRQARVRRAIDETPFVANSLQPLRANQLNALLTSALELPNPARNSRVRPSGLRGVSGIGMSGRGMLGGSMGRRSQRGGAGDLFGYDPSTLREDISGTIPQALFMMNSSMAGGAVDSNGRSLLARLLNELKDDEALVSELYLRCFAREPKPSELKTCFEYIKETTDRKEAFEDIFWALINSAEIRYRR